MEIFVYKGLYNLPSIDFECLRTIVRQTLNYKIIHGNFIILTLNFRVLFV